MSATNQQSSAPARELGRLVGWTVVWLLAFEVMVRVLWQPAWIGADLRARIDPSFGYGYDSTASVCKPTRDRIVCSPTQYRRFEPHSVARAKGPSTVRFFTVGGSHSAGPGGYHRAALESLIELCPGVSWEGVNLSVRGNGSARTLLLAQRALELEPDFLVIDFGGTNEFEDERDLAQRQQLHRGVWRLLLRSRLVALGRKLLSRRFQTEFTSLEANPEEVAASSVPENQQRWTAALEHNYTRLLESTQAAGVPVIVVGRALVKGHQDADSVERERVFRRLGTEPGSEASQKLDTNALFQEAGSNTGPSELARDRSALFAEDRNHFSELGERIVGEELARMVLADDQVMGTHPCY